MFITLSILFVLLNLLDWYLTKRILDNGGMELNPIARAIGVARSKIIFVPIFIIAGYVINPLILAIPNLIILAACIWNYLQLRKVD